MFAVTQELRAGTVKGNARRCLQVPTAALLFFLVFLAQGRLVRADTIPVRFKEGSVHGYLVLRAADGKIVAMGDLIQTLHGDRVTAHLTFRFRDGSIDDETAVFTQGSHFKLLTDHHIQKGPSFPQPENVFIDTLTCRVNIQSFEHGKRKTETDRIDLPPDLANGMLLDVIKNISPEAKETKISYLAATPKPRVVKLSITPEGFESFSIVGVKQKAIRFVVKVDLGGLTGLLAPLVGKQPADTHVWVATDQVPAFVRSAGPLYMGGPIWTIEMASPVWH